MVQVGVELTQVAHIVGTVVVTRNQEPVDEIKVDYEIMRVHSMSSTVIDIIGMVDDVVIKQDVQQQETSKFREDSNR